MTGGQQQNNRRMLGRSTHLDAPYRKTRQVIMLV